MVARNVLFIMADQLRADYLGCYGHPALSTPNLDWLAARGVRFTRAYAQSAVCGSSRMCFYTGRYVLSHGATWNSVPLRAGEMLIGDYLAPLGVRTALVGKTHFVPDRVGLARLGVSMKSGAGQLRLQGGFDPLEPEEGLYPEGPLTHHRSRSTYNDYLRVRGYPGTNPWHEWANSVEVDGRPLSGWYLDAVGRPARIPEEDSESAWLTRCGVRALDQLGAGPWCLHLSYIKPHWPYIAPAPYHRSYSAADVVPAARDARELTDPHPVYRAFTEQRFSRALADESVRERVVAAYMGLIEQLDKRLGDIFRALRDRGLLDSTLIVFTSDHGDYLGDHWLADKDYVHEPTIRIPLIVADPSREADPARGTVCDRLVESIDLLPTFMEFLGGAPPYERLEGRSLLPLLRGQDPGDWRDTAFTEYDYAYWAIRRRLEVPIRRANFVVATERRWKLVRFPGFRPMLFDLENDPRELRDLGAEPGLESIRAQMHARLLDWACTPRRVTESDVSVERRTDTQIRRGVLLGVRNALEHEAALALEGAS